MEAPGDVGRQHLPPNTAVVTQPRGVSKVWRLIGHFSAELPRRDDPTGSDLACGRSAANPASHTGPVASDIQPGDLGLEVAVGREPCGVAL